MSTPAIAIKEIDPYPFIAPLPLAPLPAHIITSDAEALEIAHRLAGEFAKEAAQRDRERRLPIAELDSFSQSGLWGITVPKAYGGADVSYVTLGQVVKIISAVDPSIGQIPQNHFVIVDHIRLDGTEEQKRFFFDLVLRGARFGNAFSEKNSKNVLEFQTIIKKDGDNYVVNGRKFYSSGALLAHWVPIVTADEAGLPHLAIVERSTPGLNIVNDWTSFGQRTTASGTVLIDNVKVPASQVIPIYQAFARPTTGGPSSQFIQAAVDLGIAEGAIRETIHFVRDFTRPWIDSGQDKATDDVYTLHEIGNLELRLHAAEALLERAARSIERGIAEPDAETVAAASIAVAEAKILTTEIAVLATNKLFELGGTRSTLEEYNLDRHWRNARTHTLHDPVRWKFHAIGNYYLNDIKPPRHPWI